MESYLPKEALRINVFFYGLFMDKELLESKGVYAQNVATARLPGFSLRIGKRATLIRNSSGQVHGVLMSLTRKEIDLLYSDETVKAYAPEPVKVFTGDGMLHSALCFNLVEPQAKNEIDSGYMNKLKSLAVQLRFPEEYINSIGEH